MSKTYQELQELLGNQTDATKNKAYIQRTSIDPDDLKSLKECLTKAKDAQSIIEFLDSNKLKIEDRISEKNANTVLDLVKDTKLRGVLIKENNFRILKDLLKETKEAQPIVQFIEMNHLKVTDKDLKGNTILHMAAQTGDRKLYDALKKEPGVDNKAVNKSGETPSSIIEKTNKTKRNILERGVTKLISAVNRKMVMPNLPNNRESSNGRSM